jgi:hypothetical protein
MLKLHEQVSRKFRSWIGDPPSVTTFRVKKVHELFSSPAERERALKALVDDDDRSRPPDEQH